MTDSSSSRHRLPHQYAAQSEQFPGWMGNGQTAQSLRPEVLAEKRTETSAARTDKPLATSRPRHKSSRKASRQ
jgi:hypothetical protein